MYRSRLLILIALMIFATGSLTLPGCGGGEDAATDDSDTADHDDDAHSDDDGHAHDDDECDMHEDDDDDSEEEGDMDDAGDDMGDEDAAEEEMDNTTMGEADAGDPAEEDMGDADTGDDADAGDVDPPADDPGEADATEEHENPWASYGVGTWVEYKTITTMDIGGNITETETISRQTLMSIDSEKIVLKMDTTANGQTFSQEMEIPLTAPAGDAVEMEMDTETGEESITVAAGDFDTTWIKIEMDMSGQVTISTSWTSDAVPGGMVKMESQSSGQMDMTTTMELVAFEIK